MVKFRELRSKLVRKIQDEYTSRDDISTALKFYYRHKKEILEKNKLKIKTPEQIAKAKLYRDTNKEIINRRKNEWRKNNKDKINRKEKEYRAQGGEAYRKKQREYARLHKEENKIYAHKYRQTPKARLNSLVRAAGQRAKKGNIPFNITVDDLLVPEYCPITMLKLEFNKDKLGNNSPSIDKLVPEKGYVKGNIKVISLKGNRWKNDMKIENVEKLLEYMKSNIS